MFGGRTPRSSSSHVFKSSLCQKAPSSSSVVFHSIGTSHRGASQRPYSHSGGSGYRTFAWHPKCSAYCSPLLGRGGWEEGSTGGGKAHAGLSPQGHSGMPATPTSLPPPPALGHHGSGTYGHLAGPPTGIAWLGVGWLLGQPWASRKPQEH